jgi:ribosomal peptide maturation radical SAM protein 1
MGLPLGARLSQGMLDRLNGLITREAEARGIETELLSFDSLQQDTERWLDEMIAHVTAQTYDVVGFSSTFEQTNGVAVLARACRSALPDVTLVAGGANCDGDMAAGMKRFIPELDVIFSGESETAFADYLSNPGFHAGREIISSPPNSNLNGMPPLDYDEFFRQLATWLPASILRKGGDLKISFETSRGCWWGQKNHCTFCGLNGSGMGYREKAPETVVQELRALVDMTGIRKIEMTDNIMPHSYFGTLIPLLAKANLGLEIFYEQKANMSLEKVLALRAAGVVRVQPGIEALNDDLLRLMRKGTSTKQNIALLRYTRSTGIYTDWNLLSGFPGDDEAWYADMLRLVSMLTHLQPPTGIYTLNFDRFSPYFERAAEYGISNLRPAGSYEEAFPACEDVSGLAYHFRGDSSGTTIESSEVVRRLDEFVEGWRGQWDQYDEGRNRPCLEVVEIDDESYMLIDSRGLPGTRLMQQITGEQASAALAFHTSPSEATRWAEAHKVCVRSHDGYIPLACAAPEVLQRFERFRIHDLADVAV